MTSGSKYSFLEVKTKLEAFCAYQERCAYELENKMKLWGVDYEDRGRLLAHLIEHNFLNEERFAEAYVSGKVNIKRWGKIKIRQHLKQKFISEYSIKKAIEGIDGDMYMLNLRNLASHKYNGLSKEKDGYPKKVKIYRFLVSKGYETDLFMDIVDELFL